jgi:hypothetical protein
MAETSAERVRRLRLQLHGWACQMATRFGAPVYLVGSSLADDPNPRDVDISIVLPDDDFAARYGDVQAWDREMYGTEWGDGRQRWAGDQVKLTRHLVTGYRMNVDLKIEPLFRAAAIYQGKPRVRLDTVAAVEEVLT